MSVFRLDGFTLAEENGVMAEQDVPRAHIHIIPRHGDDVLNLGWSGERIDETTTQEVGATVRDELASDV